MYENLLRNDSTIWISGLPPIINRSTDRGQTFTAYDTSFAASNEYTFIDNIQFYGHTGYDFSPIALLKLVDTLTTANKEVIPSQFEIRVSPNPVTDKCEISITLLNPENTILEIYSTQGLLIKKLERKLITGNKVEQDRNKLAFKELHKQLDDQKRLTEEMKRKQELGFIQLHGEVQELAIEEWLAVNFPFDSIEEIK